MFTPFQLKGVAKKIYSRNKQLSLHERIVSVYRPLYAPLDAVLSQIPPQARILDVGCGTGTLLLTAQSLIGLGECYGFDSDERSIEIAKSVNQFKNIHFCCAGSVPVSIIRSVDFISLVDVLHHIPRGEKQNFYEHIFDSASKDTTIIIKDLDPNPSWMAVANRVTDFFSTRSRVSYLGMNDIQEIMQRTGFSIKEAKRLAKHVWSHYIVVGQKNF